MPATGGSAARATAPATAATPTAAWRPGSAWSPSATGPCGHRRARPASGRSSTTAWPCCGRRLWAGTCPPTPRPRTPNRPATRRRPPPPGGALPAELAALTGTYAAWNPWIPRVRVRAAAGDGLVLVWPEGDEEPLTPLPDGGFRLGEDPASPDRVQFGAVVEGRPMQAVVNGWAFDRVD
jgi:hypothetical protein